VGGGGASGLADHRPAAVTAGEQVLTCRPTSPPGPAARNQQRPQDRPDRRLLGRGRGDPPPAAAPGRPRRPHGDLAAAQRRRDDLVAERTRTLSRLHVLLSDLQPGGAKRELTATRAAALLRQIRPSPPLTPNASGSPANSSPTCAAWTGRSRRPPGHPHRGRRARHHLDRGLRGRPGAGRQAGGHAGDITRFPDRDHFASYTGTAPVEASSGDVRRHRLNRGGNRQLNCALHLIAVCQIRDPSPGQTYYQRKLAEAKTPEEARRSLKRHLANVVYAT
jgi:transposase